MGLKSAFSKKKIKEDPKGEVKGEEVKQTELERVEQKEPDAKVGAGCFTKNVMHKRGNGTTIVFNVGQKLEKEDPDFDKLKQHLS